MERQLKFMKEMAVENEEAEEAWQREQDAKKPFSGSGQMLGAPSVVGGSVGGAAPPPGLAAKSAAATAAAARLFGRPTSESQGAAPGRPDPGAASCTGRIIGANNGGAGTRSAGTDKNTTRVNPQLEAVRTYGPGRVLAIDEAQWGGAKPDPQV